jgi:hypothetical protein
MPLTTKFHKPTALSYAFNYNVSHMHRLKTVTLNFFMFFLWFLSNPKFAVINLRKTCQTQRKWVISDYPLFNCITARKCEILYSITTKITCIIGNFRKKRI